MTDTNNSKGVSINSVMELAQSVTVAAKSDKTLSGIDSFFQQVIKQHDLSQSEKICLCYFVVCRTKLFPVSEKIISDITRLYESQAADKANGKDDLEPVLYDFFRSSMAGQTTLQPEEVNVLQHIATTLYLNLEQKTHLIKCAIEIFLAKHKHKANEAEMRLIAKLETVGSRAASPEIVEKMQQAAREEQERRLEEEVASSLAGLDDAMDDLDAMLAQQEKQRHDEEKAKLEEILKLKLKILTDFYIKDAAEFQERIKTTIQLFQTNVEDTDAFLTSSSREALVYLRDKGTPIPRYTVCRLNSEQMNMLQAAYNRHFGNLIVERDSVAALLRKLSDNELTVNDIHLLLEKFNSAEEKVRRDKILHSATDAREKLQTAFESAKNAEVMEHVAYCRNLPSSIAGELKAKQAQLTAQQQVVASKLKEQKDLMASDPFLDFAPKQIDKDIIDIIESHGEKIAAAFNRTRKKPSYGAEIAVYNSAVHAKNEALKLQTLDNLTPKRWYERIFSFAYAEDLARRRKDVEKCIQLENLKEDLREKKVQSVLDYLPLVEAHQSLMRVGTTDAISRNIKRQLTNANRADEFADQQVKVRSELNTGTTNAQVAAEMKIAFVPEYDPEFSMQRLSTSCPI